MNIASKALLLSAVLAVWSGSLLAQTIHTANSNTNAPTGANVHTTLQAALDAAQDGDIIHVIGSPNSYGNVTVRKRFHIIGIGHNPMKDLPVESSVGSINLTTGTGTNSTGTVIEGLRLTSTTTINQTVNDITIRKNLFEIKTLSTRIDPCHIPFLQEQLK
jgi:hypothetical protein